MVLYVCGWNDIKTNVLWIQEYMELWGWDDEYIIFKDIEATQRIGAIWGGKADWGPGDKYIFKYREVNNR